MTKLTYIKSLIKLLFSKKKKWELQTGHTVDIAFWSGGKPYYKLSDLFNTFTERGLDAYQTYEEIGMRIEVTALKEFVSKFKSDLNTGKLMDCAITLNFLEERVNFVIPPRNLIYKLASVAYFDETESPYTYDTIYANRKMEEIRKNGDVDDFFLYQQLGDLIPLPKLSKETYQVLQETMDKVISYQSKNISGKVSETSGAQPTYSKN